MRELTAIEIEEVSGGNPWLWLVTGAVIGYGLAMGWNGVNRLQ